MIRAALALYEATGQQTYLQQALSWQHALDRDHADAQTGTYYLTAADAEGLVIRPASTADEATPNHNAVAAQNLIRLSLFTGDDQWRDKADRLMAAIAPAAVDNLYMHMALFNAIDLRLRAAEIVVTGEGARADELLAAARSIPPLDRIVLHARERRRIAAIASGAGSGSGCRPSRKPLFVSPKPARCRSTIGPAFCVFLKAAEKPANQAEHPRSDQHKYFRILFAGGADAMPVG